MQELSNSSLSFMVVKHPLERFPASYIDKRGSWDLGVGNRSLSQFVDHMLNKPVDSWKEHWAPIHTLCPPCVRYEIIARMETFFEDSEYIIERAGLSDVLHVHWSNKKGTGSPFQRDFSFYRLLSIEQVQALAAVYRLDFELYGYDPEPYFWMAHQPSESLNYARNVTHMKRNHIIYSQQ